MAAKKNPLADKAYEMYKSGMKLVDIADQLGKPEGTIRRWKSTYGWDGERSEKKSERSVTRRTEKKTQTDDGTKETLQNDDLTPERQMFCIYYSKTFNATQSYLNAFHCSYDTANAEGYKLLVKPCVRKEIERLKEIKRQQIIAGADDIVELQMRIAFADIGNYMSFGQKEFHDPETEDSYMVSTVDLKESKNTDTQIIQEVKRGKDGVSLKLADRQKAIDWLTKYFLMHPDDKYKAEFDKKRAEVKDDSAQQILANMQTIADILKAPEQNRNIADFEESEDNEQAGTTE